MQMDQFGSCLSIFSSGRTLTPPVMGGKTGGVNRIIVVPVFQEGGGEVGMKDKEERKPSHFCDD